MKLLICVLKDYRRGEDLILALVEHGITGATYIEGRGMGQLIGEIPLFVGLRGLFPGSAVDSHVVFAALPAAQAQGCLALVDRVAGPLTEPGSGVAFLLPLEGWLGVAPPL